MQYVEKQREDTHGFMKAFEIKRSDGWLLEIVYKFKYEENNIYWDGNDFISSYYRKNTIEFHILSPWITREIVEKLRNPRPRPSKNFKFKLRFLNFHFFSPSTFSRRTSRSSR